MATFKTYGKKEDKYVIAKGKFSDFQNYNELKQKIIAGSHNPQNKGNKLEARDKFILAFDQGKGDLYIPDELKKVGGIWHNPSFKFFKEKLAFRDINASYKFIVKKVDRFPVLKIKENHEFLDEALEKYWKPIHDDIISGISLDKFEESKLAYKKLKKELEKNEEKINKEIHNKVICNNCFKRDIKGKRFICAECNNYNLCQECEKLCKEKQIHPREHTLIQVNKALNDVKIDNLYKYSNIIGNNNQEFKNVPAAFQLETSIINNGENDLKDCYILPVRYGDNYLTCGPKVIEDEVERNMAITMSLIVRLPQDNKGYFEGYFRMFTPHGLPFGDVLYIKVLNGD